MSKCLHFVTVGSAARVGIDPSDVHHHIKTFWWRIDNSGYAPGYGAEAEVTQQIRWDLAGEGMCAVHPLGLQFIDLNWFKGLQLQLSVIIFVTLPYSIITFRLHGMSCFPRYSFLCSRSSGSLQIWSDAAWMVMLSDGERIIIADHDSCIAVLEILGASWQCLRPRTPGSSPAHKMVWFNRWNDRRALIQFNFEHFEISPESHLQVFPQFFILNSDL